MAKEIGIDLALAEYFNYNDFEEVIDWQLKEMGSSLEEMKKIGVKNFKRKSGAFIWKKVKLMNFLPQVEKLNSILKNWLVTD